MLAYQIVRKSKEFRDSYFESKGAMTQFMVDVIAKSYNQIMN